MDAGHDEGAEGGEAGADDGGADFDVGPGGGAGEGVWGKGLERETRDVGVLVVIGLAYRRDCSGRV